MTPGSSSRSSPEKRLVTAPPEIDDLDWPELKRDDVEPGNKASGSRLDRPVEWSKDLKSEEEVYLDNLQTKLDRVQKAWLPSTITTEESDRTSPSPSNAVSSSSTARRRADRDDVSIAPSISDDEDDEPDRASGQNDQTAKTVLETPNPNNTANDNDDETEDETPYPHDVAATREEPNPADNPGLPLLWNVMERSETVPRTFSPPPVGLNGGREGEGNSSEEDEGEGSDVSEGEGEVDEEAGLGHVELVDAEEEPTHELVASPEEEVPSHSASPSPSPSPFPSSDAMPPPGLPPGPQHRPTTSTSLYPKPRLLSSDSKVRFSPRVRVKSGLRGGAGGTGTGSSRMGSRVPSSASVVPSSGGGGGGSRTPSNPDVNTEEDVFAPKPRVSSGHSRIGAMTTLDDPPSSRPTSRPSSHRNPSYTGMESTSLTSSASISLCASPPQNSWLFSGNSLSAALAGINGSANNNNNNNTFVTPNEERLGSSAGGTDYFSFPGSRPIDPSSRQSSLNLSNPSLVRGRSTLTPRDPEIEKLSADAARKRAESWAREHAPRSTGAMRRSASLGVGVGVDPSHGGGLGGAAGGGAGGFRTPPLESPSFESSRRTASGGILIRTYSGRYLPQSQMNANEVHYKTEQEVIWGSVWDRIKNPRWWSWKAIRGWKVVVGFWCGGDDDEEEWEERRAVLRRPPRRAG